MAARRREKARQGIVTSALRLHFWQHGLFSLIALLVMAPLAFLIMGSFSTAQLPTDFSLATMGLVNYIKVYTDPGTYEILNNTLIYVGGSACLGITLAVALAWLVERTNMPGKIWVYAGVPMTLAVPGMLQAMAWVLLLSPRIGFINKSLQHIFELDRPPVNIYSLGGMIFLEGLRLVPTAFLMLVPLMRSMDPALEEAAAVSGARPLSTARKITLRLLAPGLVAVMIYQAMTALEVFEIPGILGLPAGIYVFSTKIYAIVRSATFMPVYGQANALAMVYLIIAVVTTYYYTRMISRVEKYTIITGKGYRPRELDLGRWRYAAFGLVIFYIFLAVLLPFAVLLYTSFLAYLQAPSVEAFKGFTLKNYRFLAQYGEVGSALQNTLVMVVVTATATVLLSFFTSLVIVRSRFWGRKLLDQLAFVPHAIPGIVMGIAFFWVFLKLDFLPLYGTIWAMSIGFTVSFLSYGTRAMNAALLQVHKELEEAAYVSGARPWRTLWRIFFPLMLPSFVGIWIWVVLHAVRIAGLPLILYEGPQNQVLAILIWNMWDEGYVPAVAAIGTLLMVTLLLLTFLVRTVGFHRQFVQSTKT
ncbi:MAG TPA: iron ABC transporter permease [Candidatus Binatia bacterium]|nr:iron ABC transporter permease [Candidatus Binatia bacterium]